MTGRTRRIAAALLLFLTLASAAGIVLLSSGSGGGHEALVEPIPTLTPGPTLTAIQRGFPPPPVPSPSPTVIPGADKGGLFGDGVIDLPPVNTSGWLTYANARYGYAFQYPPDWRVQYDTNSTNLQASGAQAYPLQAVEIRNPPSDWTDTGPCGNECIGTATRMVAFSVQVGQTQCFGNLANDVVAFAGRTAFHCLAAGPGAGPQNDVGPTVQFAVPNYDSKGDYLIVWLSKGPHAGVLGEATLQAILATFHLQ